MSVRFRDAVALHPPEERQAIFQRLQLLQRRFFAEMREIVAQSSPNERVVLVATQLITFAPARSGDQMMTAPPDAK